MARLLYKLSEIAEKYEIPFKTLKNRAERSELGKVMRGVRYLEKKEVDLLLDAENHRRGKRKKEDIENIIRKRSEQNDLEFIREKMLPFYREMFEKLSKFNLVVSARAMGKSYNISWGIIESLFREESDILVVRKTQKSLSTSLFPEIREKLTHLEDFDELFDFKVNFSLEKITLTPEESLKRTIYFKGSMNPLSLKSFKSLNPVKMIVFEEAEQLSERDLREILPSFREEDVIFLFLSNIPLQGKRHFLYKMFIENPEENYKCFQPTWQDNFVLFRNQEKWEKWKKDNAPLFRGEETKEFRQSILGEWIEDTSDLVLPSFEREEREDPYSPHSYKSEVIMNFYSGKIYLLFLQNPVAYNRENIYIKREALVENLSEVFSQIYFWQQKNSRSSLRIHISHEERVLAERVKRNFISPYLKSLLKKEKWGSTFQCFNFRVNPQCEIFIQQAENTYYERDEETGVRYNRIQKNSEIYSLEALALFFSTTV